MPRVAAQRQSVDEALVASIHGALRPSRDALKAMLGRVHALGAELEPVLAAWEGTDWTARSYQFLVRDLSAPVRELRQLVERAAADVGKWQASVEALTPRMAWRLGPAHRGTALGLLRYPTLILDAFTRLRGQVADAERQVGCHQGPMPSPRPRAGFVVLSREEIHGRESAPAKKDFDPLRVGGGTAG